MRLSTWIIAAAAVGVAKHLAKPSRARRLQGMAGGAAGAGRSQPAVPRAHVAPDAASLNKAEGLPSFAPEAPGAESEESPASFPGTREFLRGA